jgi:hypothetical protein
VPALTAIVLLMMEAGVLPALGALSDGLAKP